MLRRGEQARGQRQVEAPAFLGKIGRGQVHGDPAVRGFKAGIAQRHPDAVASLAHGGLGHADHIERGQAASQENLDGYLGSQDAILCAAVGHGERHGVERPATGVVSNMAPSLAQDIPTDFQLTAPGSRSRGEGDKPGAAPGS